MNGFPTDEVGSRSTARAYADCSEHARAAERICGKVNGGERCGVIVACHATHEHPGTMPTTDVADEPSDLPSAMVAPATRLGTQHRLGRPAVAEWVLPSCIHDHAGRLHQYLPNDPHRLPTDGERVAEQAQQKLLLLLGRNRQRAAQPERRETAARVRIPVLEPSDILALSNLAELLRDSLEVPDDGEAHR